MDKHIVVIGAGYAGLAAATRAGKTQRVTLIAPEDRFLNRLRMHEVAAGRAEHRPPIAHVLRDRNVTQVQARVTDLNLAERTVFTNDGGSPIEYDTLVYALGSHTAFHGVPGAREHAYTMERAEELRDRLRKPDDAAVAVVGGGPTGIEIAAEVAEAYPNRHVTIIDSGKVGGWLTEKAGEIIHKNLARLNVEVKEQSKATGVDAEGLTTSSGRIDAPIVVWAASFEVGPLARESGLAVTDSGEALVDEHLRSVSHPGVYIVGDAAAVTLPGIGRLRKSCATAEPMGQYVGKAISEGTEDPFTFGYVGQCLSLGRKSGVFQRVEKDDAMMDDKAYGGQVGKLVKAGIVWNVVHSLR